MANATSRRALGQDAESFARSWLESHGLSFLESNYQCRYGEVDLVMQQNQEIVFVEVRLRQQTNYGDAVESVTRAKQRKLVSTALHYLQSRHLEHASARIDVLGLSGFDTDSVEWIKDAVTDE